jgi:hypothetical protein
MRADKPRYKEPEAGKELSSAYPSILTASSENIKTYRSYIGSKIGTCRAVTSAN